MAQTSLNIRMDENLKKQFDSLCEEIGMSMTTAVCIFAKKAVRERRIPFELTADSDPFYSEENMKRLNCSIHQLETGGGTVHEVDEDECR
ncbi:MAG: type II toxin-antitoxin system RelB/DinJ family antitoxin [Bacteroides sp.]|nr:type II toxin-antitoxin system RelB/DinJ family antitoxin [Bacteroides sp.]